MVGMWHGAPPSATSALDLYDIFMRTARIRPRTFTRLAPICTADPALPPDVEAFSMTDILWLGALAGLFSLTLAFVRLCDETGKGS